MQCDPLQIVVVSLWFEAHHLPFTLPPPYYTYTLSPPSLTPSPHLPYYTRALSPPPLALPPPYYCHGLH